MFKKFSKNKEQKKSSKMWRNIFLLSMALLAFLFGSIVLWISTFKIPTLDSFEERRITQSTKIYDRTGKILLYDVFEGAKRTIVPFDQISRNIKNATIAIEDRDFYNHRGVKPTSFIRAFLANILTMEFSQGGSTITQQVVKNSVLTNEKLISRKLKEWVLALKLEQVMSKDEILGLYLNEIPYGGSVYGIEEASETFFGKTASDLSIAESAYLASLPQAPTYYSPFGKHLDKLEDRKNLVLREMLRNKFITQGEYDQALKEKVVFKKVEENNIKAPHFVMFVRDYLEKKYGETVLQNGGLKVTTTLDYELESKAEAIAQKYALENETKYNAENTAITAIDPQTGQILVMVGSRNYFDKEIDGNFNIATAHRQPGSSFKPFVYAEAFNKGYTPDTVLFDLKTQFSTNCEPNNLTSENGCYSPNNYDNLFRGPITLRNALAQSINVPSIKVLYLAGIKESIQLARDMGIQGLTNSNQYGLTLVLGGGEVSLLDMTSAYGVFATGGTRNPYTSILEIKDNSGKVLESYSPNPRNVLPEQTALKISDILNDNVARTPAYGTNSFLYFPGRDVAVKTGTTNDYRDAWIVGYTPQIAVGAWAGNNDNSPMEKRVAGFIVAPIWNAFMNEALKNLPVARFKSPDTDDSASLPPVLRGHWEGGISITNGAPTVNGTNQPTTGSSLNESFAGGVHSILYWLNKNNPRDGKPANPDSDPQFKYWEYSISKWVEEKGLSNNQNNGTRVEDFPTISILSPNNNDSILSGQNIAVTIKSSGKLPLIKVEYYINNVFIGSTTNSPFSFTFTTTNIENVKDTNTLKAIGYDSAMNKAENSINFQVKK